MSRIFEAGDFFIQEVVADDTEEQPMADFATVTLAMAHADAANAKISSRRKIYIHPDFIDKPHKEWACTPNPTKGYVEFVEVGIKD